MSQTAIQEIRPWDRPFWRPVRGKAGVLSYLVLIHVLAVIGLILFPLPSLRILSLTLLFTALGGLGTTVCYHRVLAHRTLKLNKVIEQLLVFWAMFNGSGAPASWVAYHRNHHSHTDTPEDISSLKQGGFWLAAIRLVYSLHMQCLVNSLTHLGHSDEGDSSRNVWWLGPLQLTAWDENWHRNHHSNAGSARLGLRWWQTDIGWYFIYALEMAGLASNIKRPRVR